MISILHGDDITSSRKALQILRDEFAGEVIPVDLSEKQSADFSVQSSGLFEQKVLYVLENVQGNIEPEKIAKSTLNDIIFWEGKKLSDAQLKNFLESFPKAKISEFKLPTTVFAFLDSIAPGNQKQIMPLWQTYISSEVPEIAFTMIVRQFRLLLQAKSNETKGSDEWNRATWQKSKLHSQANRFADGKLQEIYSQLAEIDWRSKSGQLFEGSLTSSIELLLLTI